MQLIIIFSAVLIFISFASISQFRYRKSMTPIDRDRLDNRPMSWWQIMAWAVAVMLMLGKFDDVTPFIGYLILFILIGLRWKKGIDNTQGH
jgi:predicted CDP-diglyceride synthetase/phosphatidate cytidylyltransferase